MYLGQEGGQHGCRRGTVLGTCSLHGAKWRGRHVGDWAEACRWREPTMGSDAAWAHSSILPVRCEGNVNVETVCDAEKA